MPTATANRRHCRPMNWEALIDKKLLVERKLTILIPAEPFIEVREIAIAQRCCQVVGKDAKRHVAGAEAAEKPAQNLLVLLHVVALLAQIGDGFAKLLGRLGPEKSALEAATSPR